LYNNEEERKFEEGVAGRVWNNVSVQACKSIMNHNLSYGTVTSKGVVIQSNKKGLQPILVDRFHQIRF
jgi:hypothetical protein